MISAARLQAPASGSPQQSTNLDFLRSVAVLLVFGVHYYDIQSGAGEKWGLSWHLGRLGVLMFFVHTCLVLMWSLERSKVQGGLLWSTFYVRRALRIYPLSIACVLIAYFIDGRWPAGNLWPNLSLTQYLFSRGSFSIPPTFTPLWSLPLEMEMYVVLPLLFLVFRDRPIRGLVATWAACIPIAWIQPRLGERFLIFAFVPCFVGGVVAWRMMRTRDLRRFAGWLWPVAIAAVSLMVIAAPQRLYAIYIAVFGICLGAVIPLFREMQSEALKAISQTVARYSYGIYLTHFPIMMYVLASRENPGWFKSIPPMFAIRHFARPIDALLVVGLTAGASFVLYHVIEKPGIEVGRRLAQRLIDSSKAERQQARAQATGL